MAASSGLIEVSASKFTVASQGRGRLRVKGRNWGQLIVDGQRRWVWGRFDETFVVSLTGKAPIAVVTIGLLGKQRTEVSKTHVTDIQTKSFACAMPSLSVRIPTVRSRQLTVQQFTGPRIVRLDSQIMQSMLSKEAENE